MFMPHDICRLTVGQWSVRYFGCLWKICPLNWRHLPNCVNPPMKVKAPANAKALPAKMAARPRTKPAEVRLDELMAAAETLFLAQGVEATTINEIVDMIDEMAKRIERL